MSEKFHYHLVILTTGLQSPKYIYVKGKIRALTKKDIDICFEKTNTTLEDGIYRIHSINYLGHMTEYFFQHGYFQRDAWIEFDPNTSISFTSLGLTVSLRLKHPEVPLEITGRIVSFGLNHWNQKLLRIEVGEDKHRQGILLSDITHYRIININKGNEDV